MPHPIDVNQYARIEAEIASDESPVGIDARRTHVMILARLESIEARLEAIERRGSAAGTSLPDGAALAAIASAGVGAATDAFDEEVARLAGRGVDVDVRLRAALRALERLTDERSLAALERLANRLPDLAPLVELAHHAPHAVATATDAFDEEVARLAERGLEVDTALRNGVAALLYLGQRISTAELEALGELLRSDVLHPRSVDLVGRLGRALVAAAEAPRGSVGPFGALSRLGDRDTRRSTAFLLEFARRFGAALDADAPADADRTHDAHGRNAREGTPR